MTFSGDLSGINLADVFQNIGQNRISGTLQVKGRSSERWVLFQEGAVAGLSLGVNKGLPVAEHLVHRGYVRRERLEAALKRRRKQRKLLRTILHEMKVLAEPQFDAALAELVQEQVYELMLLKEAHFTFTEGPPPPRVFDTEQKSARLRLDPGPLLIESARRSDELERIHKVVVSERDLFVMLEGWERAELHEVAAEVALFLDGRTEIRTILGKLPFARFDVLKAISDLVLAGLARPCNGSEIVQMAHAALADGDDDHAVLLLTQALTVERSNQELRQKLADLLERLGRREDAAAEHVLLGYHASQTGQVEEALAHYAKAAELNPNDLMLHERRVQILEKHGPVERYAPAALQLSDLLLAMGLADRAGTVLRKALQAQGLEGHLALLEKLAQVEASLGRGAQAAQVFLDAAESCGKDEARRLEILKRALEQSPQDEALAARVVSLETGQGKKRRARRRRVLAAAMLGTAGLAAAFAGVVEIAASHQVMQAVEQSLTQITQGEAASAITDLQRVHAAFGWTPAGMRAGEMVDQLVNLQVQKVEGMLAEDRFEEAMRELQTLYGAVQREDHQRRLLALQERMRLEQKAFGVLVRADKLPPDEAALQELERMASPELLDFYLRRLQKSYARARAPMLRALLAMDNPRALAVAARLYVQNKDPEVDRLCSELLRGAERHRKAGREDEWRAVYPELLRAGPDAETLIKAQRALAWLRGKPGAQH